MKPTMNRKMLLSAWFEGILQQWDSGGLSEAKFAKALQNMVYWRHEYGLDRVRQEVFGGP